MRTLFPPAVQDPYANSFKPRWRGVPDWPSKEDRSTGKGGWVAERKCVGKQQASLPQQI